VIRRGAGGELGYFFFVFFRGGGGGGGSCAMHQAVIHLPLTSEARVQSQAVVCEIVLSWHWDRFSPSILVFSCKFNTNKVTRLFNCNGRYVTLAIGSVVTQRT
jgi:hypothetical protein